MPRRRRNPFRRRARTRTVYVRARRRGRAMRRSVRRVTRKPSITGLLAIVLPQAVAVKAAWDSSGGGSDIKAFAQTYTNRNIAHYTGYDPGTGAWSVGDLAVGWGPIIGLKAIRMAKRMSGVSMPKGIPVTL